MTTAMHAPLAASALGAVAAALPHTTEAQGREESTRHGTGKSGSLSPAIQLYTVRASMANDTLATLTALAGMAYREVEFAGLFDHAPETIRSWMDELGLESPSGHVSLDDLRNAPDSLIETALVLGQQYLTLGWLAPEHRQDIGQYREWAKLCNRVGEMASAHGLRVAWHNHDFELLALDGVIPYEVLLEETDPDLVDFELDFFWVRKAGLEVVDILRKAPGRFTMAHLKDFDANGNMADVGSGTTDFAAILADPSAAAMKHAFVERDDAPEPMLSAAISRQRLMSLI